MSREPAFSTKTRELIKARSGGRCERCGGRGAEYSHRRTRTVRDAHTACPCNALWSCRTCHAWLHKNPSAALEEGVMLSRYTEAPYAVAVVTIAGLVVLDCEGGWTPVRPA